MQVDLGLGIWDFGLECLPTTDPQSAIPNPKSKEGIMFDQRSYETNGLFYLRWTARILSLASISLLFFFILGEGFEFNKVELKEWLGMLFFPIGLVIGLLMSWKNEGLGSVVSLVSLLAFYFVYGLLLYGKIWQGWAFLVFAIPAFLFFVYWRMEPRKFADFHHV